MPESAEEIYARVVAAVDAGGRLPMPPVDEWDIFPWEVVDGRLAPRVVEPPLAAEEPRRGVDGVDCVPCAGEGDAVRIWENDRWKLVHPPRPGGLPLVLWLMSKEHMDYADMSDELAAEYGRLSVWLCRIIERMEHVGRVHVCRYGDGSEHLHVWFFARPARLPHLLGSLVIEWNEMLPPVPEDVWRDDLRYVATRLAHHDGWSLV